MTNSDMPDPWMERVSEYVDDELPPRERLAFEEHLAGCAQCASLADAMRQVAARAGRLDVPVEVLRDLWPGIAARLEPRHRRPFAFLAGRLPWLRPQLAAAVVLVLACAAAAWLLWPGRERAAGRPASQPESTGAIRAETGSEREWQATVARLQREAQARLTLDPHVAEVLDDNLATLDAAIAAYRDALAEHPADTGLRDRLNVARQQKLDVLQQAVSLTFEGAE